MVPLAPGSNVHNDYFTDIAIDKFLGPASTLIFHFKSDQLSHRSWCSMNRTLGKGMNITRAKLVPSCAVALIAFAPSATAQSERATFGGTIDGWHT